MDRAGAAGAAATGSGYPCHGDRVSTSHPPAGPFAPPADLATHPAVVAAVDVAEHVLAPRATAADDPARGVTREACEAVARAGRCR